MLFSKLVKHYLYLYFHPRANLEPINQELASDLLTSGWEFIRNCYKEEQGRISIHSHLVYCGEDGDLERRQYHLEFYRDNLPPHIYQLYDDRDENLFNIFDSMESMFYMVGHCEEKKTFFHNIARALFQLAKNNNNIKKNDFVRTYYIRYLFYNSFLYGDIWYLTVKNGVLYYRDVSLKEVFECFLSINNSSNNKLSTTAMAFCQYYLSIVNFLENGLTDENTTNNATSFNQHQAWLKLGYDIGLDDEYLPYCHYGNFFDNYSFEDDFSNNNIDNHQIKNEPQTNNKRVKRQRVNHKKLAILACEMSQFNSYNQGHLPFVYDSFLFNYHMWIHNPEKQLSKYLSQIGAEQYITDIIEATNSLYYW